METYLVIILLSKRVRGKVRLAIKEEDGGTKGYVRCKGLIDTNGFASSS